MKYVIKDSKYKYVSAFDTDTGAYIRTGILDENNKDTGVDPFMAPNFSKKDILLTKQFLNVVMFHNVA